MTTETLPVTIPTNRQTIIYDHVRRSRPELALQVARGDQSALDEAVAAVREYRGHLGYAGEPRPTLRSRRLARRNAVQTARFPALPTKSPDPRAGEMPKRSRTVAPFVRSIPDPLWRPLCMSTEDYGGWLVFNDKLTATGSHLSAKRPCTDCPASYAAEMRADNLCNGEPGLVA